MNPLFLYPSVLKFQTLREACPQKPKSSRLKLNFQIKAIIINFFVFQSVVASASFSCLSIFNKHKEEPGLSQELFDPALQMLNQGRFKEFENYISEHSIDINGKNSEGNSFLHLTDSVSAVRFLMDNGADIFSKNRKRQTVYKKQTAAYNKVKKDPLNKEKAEVVKLVGFFDRFEGLVYRSKKEFKDSFDEEEFFELLKDFIKKYGVSAKGPNDTTLLHQLEFWGYGRLVWSYHADFKVKDGDGNTPLQKAIKESQPKRKISFLQDLEDAEHAQELLNQGRFTDFLHFITEKNISINYRFAKKGDTFLHRAKDIKVLQFLLSMGANPKVENDYKNTALEQARRFGPVEKVQFLYQVELLLNNPEKLKKILKELKENSSSSRSVVGEVAVKALLLGSGIGLGWAIWDD